MDYVCRHDSFHHKVSRPAVNDSEYKQWVKQLPNLTSSQASDVCNRVKILKFASAKEFNGKQEVISRTLQVICDVMNKKGVDCPSVRVLERSSALAASRDKLSNLSRFLDSISKSKLVQNSILSIAVECLYIDLLNWGVPVSAHTVLQQIHRIPAVLNKSFPGYAASGVLHKLVKEGK